VRVFLSGIITTPYAREFLSKCAGALRDKGFECYIPSNDRPADHASQSDNTTQRDYEALDQAEALIAVLDGFAVSDGVAGHIGTFYALMQGAPAKKGIIGILHDSRVARWDWAAGARALNYYVLGCIEERGRVFRSFGEALAELLRWDGRVDEARSVDAGLA
jgi:nucleoside 2-deoxyribosyltransferase